MTRLISMVVSRMRPQISFPPIHDLDRLDGIPILFRVIARNVYAYDNWPGRNDCARLAVDILNVMSLSYNLAEAIVAVDVHAFPDGRDFTRSRIRRRRRNFGDRSILRLFLEQEDGEEVDDDGSDGPSSEVDDVEQSDTPPASENTEGAGQHNRIALPVSGIPFLPPNLHRGTAGSNSNLNTLGGTHEATSARRPNMLLGGVRRDEQDRINGLL